MKKPKQNKQSASIYIPITMCNDYMSKGTLEKLFPNKTYELLINYPLTHPARFNIKTGTKGMGIIQLIKKIGQLYRDIYESEPDTEYCDDNGKYGIYGHSIDDLML